MEDNMDDNPEHSGENAAVRKLPACRSCGCDDLTVVEHFDGVSEWYDVTLDANGNLLLDAEASTSGGTPNGRWTIRCQGCDHEWPTKRRPL